MSSELDLRLAGGAPEPGVLEEAIAEFRCAMPLLPLANCPGCDGGGLP